MTAAPLLLALCLGSPLAAHAARLSSDAAGLQLQSEEAKYCCCKQGQCRGGAVSEGEEKTPAVYSPQYSLCCKRKSWSCGNLMTFGYKTEAPSPDFCEAPQDTGFKMPELQREADVQELKPGSPGHTMHSYCDVRKQGAEDEPGDGAGAIEGSSASTNIAARQRRNAAIGELVKELSRNSLDSMAKEIFSLYVCVRWAPNAEFTRLATDEAATEQLPQDLEPLELYAKSRFIPMRCSRNVHVYDAQGQEGETHFKDFEATMEAISAWLSAEAAGAVQRRMRALQDARGEDLEAAARAFDAATLERRVAECSRQGKALGEVLLDVDKASTEELLQDCAAAAWWLRKLRDWHEAMPFLSFMSPDEGAAAHGPKDEEQVLVCFGKRVASQLHRRAGGDHLLTDQNAMGCHGFWDLEQSAAMLHRTVQLWRPPTCQLARMELDMKIKIMDVIADMNSQLFDAMPAMLMDEMDEAKADSDGKALHAAGALGIVGGFAKSMAGAVGGFFTLKKAYGRLGKLLANTVVKWAVCPLRPLQNFEEEDALDSVLGTEDDLARHYAEQAYARWTGKKTLLPGQECSSVEGSPTSLASARCQECNLGIMKESMPEPYENEDFICPVRPLLPPKPQLKVLAEKRDLCVMHMTAPQWAEKEWMYRGRSPHRKQYNMTENPPTAGYEIIKITSWRSVPDADFGIYRDFVTYGRRCTEEEQAATPRWCAPPEVANPSEAAITEGLRQIANGVGTALGAGTGAIGKGLEAAGYKQETAPTNKAVQNRMIGLVYGAVKEAERGFKSAWSSILGQAQERYGKLHGRSFAEVEAGELLHSASFQKEIPKTGADSKSRQQYDRYAVVCPCPGFDPKREFRLKYTAGERALHLATKAGKQFNAGNHLFKSQAFTVQLQAASVLHMEDNENAWTSSSVYVRAAVHGEELPEWYKTKNPIITKLAGVSHMEGTVSEDAVYGFQATFACGPRQTMYDLSKDFTLPNEQLMPFGECVKQGAEKNKELREAAPTTLFFPQETVVRVTFAPLSTCYHEHFTKDQGKPAYKPTANPTEPPKRNFFEAENAVYQAFSRSGSGCAGLDATARGALPKELRESLGLGTYRGLLVAHGLPKDSLLEVLLEPEDVLSELGSL